MSKIEECYLLFKQYCKKELLYLTSINFYEDESGEILDDENVTLLYFNNFEHCINQLKEKLK